MAEDKMQTITELFKKLKFKKKLIGGIDEADVWAKLDKLQKEYRRAYELREAELQAVIAYQEKFLIGEADLDEYEPNGQQ